MILPRASSGFGGFRFPRELILLAGRWYLRYGLSYRDVDHVSICRWMQRFTPEFTGAARPCRHTG